MNASSTSTQCNRALQTGEAWLVLCAVLQVCMAGLVRHLISDRQADLVWMVAIRFLIGLGLIILPGLAGHWSLRVHNRAAFVGRGVFGAACMLVYFIVSNQVAFLSQCAFGLVMVLPFLRLARWPGTADIWGLMLVMIACDIASQFCLSHGLASVPVARGTTILLLIPVLSLLAGVGLFAEHLSVRQWSGCVLVTAAAMLAVVARESKRQATNCRQLADRPIQSSNKETVR